MIHLALLCPTNFELQQCAYIKPQDMLTPGGLGVQIASRRPLPSMHCMKKAQVLHLGIKGHNIQTSHSTTDAQEPPFDSPHAMALPDCF